MDEKIRREAKISIKVYCPKCHKTFYLSDEREGIERCIYCSYGMIKTDKRRWDR